MARRDGTTCKRVARSVVGDEVNNRRVDSDHWQLVVLHRTTLLRVQVLLNRGLFKFVEVNKPEEFRVTSITAVGEEKWSFHNVCALMHPLKQISSIFLAKILRYRGAYSNFIITLIYWVVDSSLYIHTHEVVFGI